jgi:hypothetical protein
MEKLRIGAHESVLACPGCDFECVHPLETYCSTADDGAAPFSMLRIHKVGLDVVAASPRELHKGVPGVPNRQRELDTVLLFWCEGCLAIFKVSFGFHKGSVLVNCILTEESVGLD